MFVFFLNNLLSFVTFISSSLLYIFVVMTYGLERCRVSLHLGSISPFLLFVSHMTKIEIRIEKKFNPYTAKVTANYAIGPIRS